MILTELEIEQVLEQAKSAFPQFTDWEYNNEKNSKYYGFALWGKYTLSSETDSPRNYFITLDTYASEWQGHLTIGKPVFLWSNTDVGDAHLIDTNPSDSLDTAIAILEAEINRLWGSFTA